GGRLKSLGRSEGGLFPGFVALALAGVAVALYTRGPARPRLPAWPRPVGWLLIGPAVAAGAARALVAACGGGRLTLGSVRVLTIRDLTLEVNALPVLALAWLILEGRRGLRGLLAPREWMLVLLLLVLLTYLLCLAPTLLVDGQSYGVTLFRWVYL